VSKPPTAAKDRLRYERSFRAELWKGKSPPEEAFEPVAQLITPKPPIWLKEHLRRWLPMHAYAVEILQPSRAEMTAILTKVAEAASVLTKALDSSAIVEFLDPGADQPLRTLRNLLAKLVDIGNRAAAAASRSPAAYAVEILQPSRAEMRANLTKVAEAALVLIKALDSSAIVEFLDLGADQPFRAPGNLQATLVDIGNRAAAASRSPALVDSEGRTKAGRGRALPKAGISAKTYCALLIGETWLYFRGDYPPPRNKQAAEAAHIYWGLLGSERQPWERGELIAWRRHFREASKDQSAEVKALRAEYQRHLHESARMEALTAEDPSKSGT